MKVPITILLILAVLAGATAMVFFNWPKWLFHHHEYTIANEMIPRIETFRASHHHLPATSDELGFHDPDERVFYIKVSDDEYCLSFGTTLGKSETYWSHERKWQEGRECVPVR